MNRSVLVVLVDFLLISLVTLYSERKPAGGAKNPAGAQTGVEVRAVQDMLGVLKQALAQEKGARGQLNAQLAAAQTALQQKQAQLAQREQQIRQYAQNLTNAEARTRQLAQQRAQLEQKQTQTQKALQNLQNQYAQSKQSLQELQNRVHSFSTDASISRAKLNAIQSELQSRRSEVQHLQGQIMALVQTNLVTQNQKQQLAVSLGKAQTEANLTRQQLQQSQGEIQSLNQERTRLEKHATTLAQGMTNIVRQSQAIATQMRENQEYTANAIYGAYLTNRVEARMNAQRSSLFGLTHHRQTTTQTIFFRDGTNVFALFHVAETPLPQWGGGPDWDDLTVTLWHGLQTAPLRQLWLTSLDPRVVVAPVSPGVVARFDVKVYSLAPDPAKYQQAVLVGNKEGYYGEMDYRLDPANPRYLKVHRRPLGRIFGKFSPSRGDLVFSKQGRLLGLMVNSQYCVLLRQVRPVRILYVGQNITSQHTSALGADISARIQSLPSKLQ